MKKVKIALWIVFLVFVVLVGAQNWSFFNTTTGFVLYIPYVIDASKDWPNWYLFVAFFMFGILITYFFSLFRHYKDSKTIKMLKSKEASLVEAVSTLEKQLPQKNVSTAPVDSVTIQPVKEEPVEAVPENK